MLIEKQKATPEGDELDRTVLLNMGKIFNKLFDFTPVSRIDKESYDSYSRSRDGGRRLFHEKVVRA